MGQDLDKLLDRVTAHYQPIMDLGSGNVIGFEALARKAEVASTRQPGEQGGRLGADGVRQPCP